MNPQQMMLQWTRPYVGASYPAAQSLGWIAGEAALGAGIGWLVTKNVVGAQVGAAVGVSPLTAGIGWLITRTPMGALVGGAIGGGLRALTAVLR